MSTEIHGLEGYSHKYFLINLQRSAPPYESHQIVPFTLNNLLIWQEKAAWKSVPLLSHTDINGSPLRHSVNTWVSSNPVKFWVQVQGPMVAYRRQKVANKAKEIGDIYMTTIERLQKIVHT